MVTVLSELFHAIVVLIVVVEGRRGGPGRLEIGIEGLTHALRKDFHLTSVDALRKDFHLIGVHVLRTDLDGSGSDGSRGDDCGGGGSGCRCSCGVVCVGVVFGASTPGGRFEMEWLEEVACGAYLRHT